MKRYDMRYDDCGMEEYDDGPWVSYETARSLYDALEYLYDNCSGSNEDALTRAIYTLFKVDEEES